MSLLNAKLYVIIVFFISAFIFPSVADSTSPSEELINEYFEIKDHPSGGKAVYYSGTLVNNAAVDQTLSVKMYVIYKAGEGFTTELLDISVKKFRSADINWETQIDKDKEVDKVYGVLYVDDSYEWDGDKEPSKENLAEELREKIDRAKQRLSSARKTSAFKRERHKKCINSAYSSDECDREKKAAREANIKVRDIGIEIEEYEEELEKLGEKL